MIDDVVGVFPAICAFSYTFTRTLTKAELEQNLNYSVDVVTLPLTRPDKINIGKVVSVYERT